MNKGITLFLEERKANWLKRQIKISMSDKEQRELVDKAINKFSPANWLPYAAKRASYLSIVSHPSKFSHPTAKTTSIIATAQSASDGYLRTGNVDYELDVLGNAASMDVYKFLSLSMDDGQTVLQHLERDSVEIQASLAIPSDSYENLKKGFMSIKVADCNNKTDQLVKQVYFPIGEAYHLLSLLTPSGLLMKLKMKIDVMHFSEATRQAKESHKKKEFHEIGYDDLLDLTAVVYGGTKPQNVSALNSKNAGLAYLLPSLPPLLQNSQIRLPVVNFFRDSLRLRQFQDSFQALDTLIHRGINSKHIRISILNTLRFLIDQVMQHAFQIRTTSHGWSESEHYQALSLAQQIWLDDSKVEQRIDTSDWLDEIVISFSEWLLNSYEYLHRGTHIKLSNNNGLLEFKKIVAEVLESDKAFLK